MSTSIPKISRNAKIKAGCLSVMVLGPLLLGFAVFSVFDSASLPAIQTTASLNAAGIAKAIHLYAQDHDGKFPEGLANSNQAFRQLFPDYIEDEKLFFVPGSAWHDAAPDRRPDNNIGVKPAYIQCLEKGENHWAYVSGLNTSSPSHTPLIADGFAENQPGTYTGDSRKKGGRWADYHGRTHTPIVILAGGGVEFIKINKRTGYRVLREKPGTGQKVDIFTREGGLPENAKVLNPE